VPALTSTTSSNIDETARMPNMFTQAAATSAMYATASASASANISSSNRTVGVIQEELQEDEDDELQLDEEEITGAPRFLFQVRSMSAYTPHIVQCV
jgi:hypothetical protein